MKSKDIKKYRIILKLSKEQIYEFIPLLPEKLAEDVISQTEKEETYKLGAREYHRQYYQKNKDKINKAKKKWVGKNRDRYQEYQKEYYKLKKKNYII